MATQLMSWAPAGILGLGALFTVGIDAQKEMPLREPLDTAVPSVIEGLRSTDIEISEAEQAVAGMSSYVMRTYAPADEAGTQDQTAAAFSIYVGYYESQTQGKTIHSPKNCLPGGGWEPLVSRQETVARADGGTVTVNRYLLQREKQQALVMYWYQGRGRTEANEYVVKWDLLRDAALTGRTEEALVRIIVPVTEGEDAAFALASRVASQLAPAVDRAMPI